MAERQVRVWRLRVLFPLGAFDYGFEPEGWEPEPCHCRGDDCWGHEFRWPRKRNYLSEKAAHERARLFRQYGAEVFVEASEPVEWS